MTLLLIPTLSEGIDGTFGIDAANGDGGSGVEGDEAMDGSEELLGVDGMEAFGCRGGGLNGGGIGGGVSVDAAGEADVGGVGIARGDVTADEFSESTRCRA